MGQQFGSTMLIALLRSLDKQLSVSNLTHLLLTQEHTFKRMAYGHHSPRTGIKNLLYWPKLLDWQCNAPDIFKSGKEDTKLAQKYKDNLFRKEDERYISPESRAFDVLLFCMKEYQKDNNLDFNEIQNKILYFLEGMKIDEGVILSVRNAENEREIARLLVETAANFGRVSVEKKPAYFATVSMAKKMGLTTLQLAENLLENDRTLYGSLGNNAGTSHQWSEHMEQQPGNWGFLMVGKKVVGNYSMTLLTPEQEALYSIGELTGDKKTALAAASPNSPKVAIDLMNLSILEGYDTEDNYHILWTKFGERLLELALNGSYFRTIYTCLFKSGQKKFFEKRGFKFHCARSGDGNGQLFSLDLTYGIPDEFSAVLSSLYQKYAGGSGSRVSFERCSSAGKLTTSRAQEISTLLLRADQHIYTAMFDSVEQGKLLLGKLLYMDTDTLFTANNFFLSLHKGRVVGLIHFCLGAVAWSGDPLREEARYARTSLPESVSLVEEKYYPTYNQTDQNLMTLLEVCIDPMWRDMMLGEDMLEAFMKEFGHKYDMESRVLVNNEYEFDLLRKARFTCDLVEHEGFSKTQPPPRYYLMKRNAKAGGK